MTTKRYYKLPDKLPNPCDVKPITERWPITNLPPLRYTRKKARKIRRLRQLNKGKTYLVVVYLVTFP